MKKDIFCAGVSFTGRSYTALRNLEKALPEMKRSEIIGRALLIADRIVAKDATVFCARQYNPRAQMFDYTGEEE